MTDTPIDAFRHAGSSAILTRDFTEGIAARLGTANEVRNGSPNPLASPNVMDEFNNYVGRKTGLALGDVEIGKIGPITIYDVPSVEEIRDEIEKSVVAGVTINGLDDPRIEIIRLNLGPGETVPEMLERTEGIVQGPRGQFDLMDPRGPWQDPFMVDNNIGPAPFPTSSIRPPSRPSTEDPRGVHQISGGNDDGEETNASASNHTSGGNNNSYDPNDDFGGGGYGGEFDISTGHGSTVSTGYSSATGGVIFDQRTIKLFWERIYGLWHRFS